MFLTGAILAMSVIIILNVIMKALLVKNHVGLEKVYMVKRAVCTIMVVLQTFGFMPLFDIIIRTMFTSEVGSDQGISDIFRYILGSFALLFFGILMVYII